MSQCPDCPAIVTQDGTMIRRATCCLDDGRKRDAYEQAEREAVPAVEEPWHQQRGNRAQRRRAAKVYR